MSATKVLVFTSADRGGAQRGNVVLANALADHGLSVRYVMPRLEGPFLGELSPKIHPTALGTTKRIECAQRLARTLNTEKPAVVLASQMFGINTAIAARFLAREQPRIIGIQHNVISRVCRNGSVKTRLVMPLVIRMLYRRADALVAVSRGAAADLSAMTGVPGDRIAVIPATTITPRIERLAVQPSGYSWLDERTCPVILAVGDLRAVKDYATLVEAFAKVRRIHKARLLILGEGKERLPLQRLIDKLGLHNDAQLPGHDLNPYACMARADVLALSSRHEGFGNVLLEAMACGCPVVSTACPYGPREILDDGRYGRLVPVGDAGAMATAFYGMLNGHSFSKGMLRKRAAEFSIERMVGKYLDLLARSLPQSEAAVVAA